MQALYSFTSICSTPNSSVHNTLACEADQTERVVFTPVVPPRAAVSEDRSTRSLISPTDGQVSTEIACLPEWVTNPLRNELMCSLLGCMYALLYQAYRGGRLAAVLPVYLNSHTLPELKSVSVNCRILVHFGIAQQLL